MERERERSDEAAKKGRLTPASLPGDETVRTVLQLVNVERQPSVADLPAHRNGERARRIVRLPAREDIQILDPSDTQQRQQGSNVRYIILGWREPGESNRRQRPREAIGLGHCHRIRVK